MNLLLNLFQKLLNLISIQWIDYLLHDICIFLVHAHLIQDIFKIRMIKIVESLTIEISMMNVMIMRYLLKSLMTFVMDIIYYNFLEIYIMFIS